MEQEVGLAHAGSDGLGQVKKAPVEHTLRLKTIAIEGDKRY